MLRMAVTGVASVVSKRILRITTPCTTFINRRGISGIYQAVYTEAYNTPADIALKPAKATQIKTVERRKNKDGTIQIEGKYNEVPIDMKAMMLDSRGCCPMCSLNLPVQYTDVLILKQFLKKDGGLLPRRVTGLCAHQQQVVNKLVHKAKNAGLLSEFRPPLPEGITLKPDYEHRYKFKGLKRYFTDKY